MFITKPNVTGNQLFQERGMPHLVNNLTSEENKAFIPPPQRMRMRERERNIF